MSEAVLRLQEARGRVIRRYLRGPERADAPAILRLFAPGGEVTSPLYGRRPAGEFYPLLFAATARSRIALHRRLASLDDPDTLAADFAYEWDLADGTAARFRCVDVFTFGPVAKPSRGAKIRHLAIVYGTALVPRRGEGICSRPEGSPP
jgi:hypothetical protein